MLSLHSFRQAAVPAKQARSVVAVLNLDGTDLEGYPALLFVVQN